MTARLALIRRHPVKSVGWEALTRATLAPGAWLPFDRQWAVAHGAATLGGPGAWAECHNFLRVAHIAALAAVSAGYDAATGLLTLTHPERPALTLDPDREPDALTDWLAPLVGKRQPGPFRLVKAEGAMTDSRHPRVSVKSLASLRALSEHLGQPLDPSRFRGNLWIDGLAPWAERDWIGREIAIGAVRLRVTKHIERCSATTANPATGQRDAPVLRGLKELVDAPEFGVNAEVIAGGEIALGDAVTA